MAIQLTFPQPGDLITAAYMRDLITTLQQLDARIAALEGIVPGASGTLAITDLQWLSADLHIGDELRIIGVNLGLQGETRVDFDGLAGVTVFKPGSGDKLIILDVPAMALGGPSKTMPLIVSNPRTGAAQRNVTVFQGVPTKPDGTINIAAPQFPPGNIQPSADLTITFPIMISTLNMDTVFNISTSASLLTSPPVGMTAVALNDVNQPISTIPLPKSEGAPTTRTIKVRVSIPALPQNVTQAPANVIVALSTPANPAFSPSSGQVPFTVGAPPPVNAFSFDVTGVQGPGSYDAANAILHLPLNTTPPQGYLVGLRADLSSMTGGEAYTVTMTPGDNRWSITGPTGFTLNNPGPQQLTYRMSGSAGAPQTTLTVTIAGTNPQHSSKKAFTLSPT